MASFLADNRASRLNFTTSCPSFNDAVGVIDSNDIGDSLEWPVTQSDQKVPKVPVSRVHTASVWLSKIVDS